MPIGDSRPKHQRTVFGNDKYLSIKHAAAVTGIKANTLQRRIHDNMMNLEEAIALGKPKSIPKFKVGMQVGCHTIIEMPKQVSLRYDPGIKVQCTCGRTMLRKYGTLRTREMRICRCVPRTQKELEEARGSAAAKKK